jgi:hypothetical protein
MLISAKSNSLTLNGYSGIHTRLAKKLLATTSSFPDKSSLLFFKSFAGLRYVFFKIDQLSAYANEDLNLRLIAYQDKVRVLQRINDQFLLLELINQENLSEIDELYLPSKGTKRLFLKLKTAEKQTSLKVFLAGEESSDTLLADLALELGESTITIPIPDKIEAIKPLKIKFLESQKGTVKLIDSGVL